MPGDSAPTVRDHGGDHTSRDWLVWSFEHDAWWGPNECGYVQKLAAAGRYTREEALTIEARANRAGVINERATSLEEVERQIRGVDGAAMMRHVEYVLSDPTYTSPGPAYTAMAREIVGLRAAAQQLLADLEALPVGSMDNCSKTDVRRLVNVFRSARFAESAR